MRRLVVAAGIGLALAAGSARADDGPVLGFTVGGTQAQAPVSVPTADSPNAPDAVSVPASFTVPPANPQRLSQGALQQLWQSAGRAYGIPWQVLAAINKIESNFGQNMGPSSAGAVGWMQFMPDTWLRWGVDADGNGIADPWNSADAIYAAARYLAACGGQTDISRAVYSYNHADWYVNEVMSLAHVYGAGGPPETADLQQLQQGLDAERQQIVAANARVVSALRREQAMQSTRSRLDARVGATELLSDRLAAQKRAVLYDVHVQQAHGVTEEARIALRDAEQKLLSAQQQAQAPSFASGAGSVLGAPSYAGDYVFPVGGGPSVVSAAHTHHDYPAVDIAAPEGSPVYALANAVVLDAWHAPDGRCGIGLTLRAEDGQVWTYCHLSYLGPSVADGAQLAAGAQIGLVGHTGHATGPHLHLQLQPATSWPQRQAWFQAFAGRAFRWQDAPTPLVQPDEARVFAVAQGSLDPVITFSR
jgi:murein DD-endopeptidase MepM/ murein hydrolase activator NlpD